MNKIPTLKDRLIKHEKEVIKMFEDGASYIEIQRKYGVSEATLTRFLKDLYASKKIKGRKTKIAIKERVIDLRRDLLEKENIIERLQSEMKQLKIKVGTIEIIQEYRTKPFRIEKKALSKTTEATAVLVMSDIHAGEVVNPATVNYKNKYNKSICKDRCSQLFQRALRLIEIQRSGVEIRELVICLLGDLIHGYIHEEFLENNDLSPIEAVLEMQDNIISGIEFLLSMGKFDRIRVVCMSGNHGRTTDKQRSATLSKNSFEWLLYKQLEKYFSGNNKIEFYIPIGWLYYFDVYSTKIRCLHGDIIKYGGGIGGLEVPLKKAISQWDKTDQANITILGNWHQLIWGNRYVVNGSIVGYNAYAVKIKAEYEPATQALFLIDNKRKKTIQCPVFLD